MSARAKRFQADPSEFVFDFDPADKPGFKLDAATKNHAATESLIEDLRYEMRALFDQAKAPAPDQPAEDATTVDFVRQLRDRLAAMADRIDDEPAPASPAQLVQPIVVEAAKPAEQPGLAVQLAEILAEIRRPRNVDKTLTRPDGSVLQLTEREVP